MHYLYPGSILAEGVSESETCWRRAAGTGVCGSEGGGVSPALLPWDAHTFTGAIHLLPPGAPAVRNKWLI